MKDQIEKTKKIFKDGFEILEDYFKEKRSDTIYESEKEAKKGKVALAKFSKGLIGKTEEVNFRILIGEEKVIGDHIYEAVFNSEKKSPKIYIYKLEKGKPSDTILTSFKDKDWDGYKKVEEFKSLTEFLEEIYKEGVYYEGKKEKKEDALNKLIKGLKRSLEAVQADEQERCGEGSERAKRIGQIVAAAAVTTVVSAVLTPAAGVVAAELMSGGTISGDVIGAAGEAAAEGVKNLADPAAVARKIAQKAATKGRKIPGLRDN